MLKLILRYGFNWLHLLDQAFNTLLGGDPRQTLSGRMGRNITLGKNCVLCHWTCRLLNFIQPDHCVSTWANEKKPLDPDMQITDE